jgi:multisubunit Na+/H+ antiporter MnhE subunit
MQRNARVPPPATPTSLNGLLLVLRRQYKFLTLVWGPYIHLGITIDTIHHHLLSKRNHFVNIDGFIWHLPIILWEIVLATMAFFKTSCIAQYFDDSDISSTLIPYEVSDLNVTSLLSISTLTVADLPTFLWALHPVAAHLPFEHT